MSGFWKDQSSGGSGGGTDVSGLQTQITSVNTKVNNHIGDTNSHVTSADKANINKAHTHTNKSVLDKFTENSGTLLYNGEEIGGNNSPLPTSPTLTTLTISNSTLTLTNNTSSGNNYWVDMTTNTTITLPTVTNYTEIRLWFKCDSNLSITFPSNVAWQNTPETYGGYVYEYIFTYVNGMWVGGFVAYEVGESNA